MICAICVSESLAQSCDWHIYEKGKQVTFEIRNWPNPYYSNPEFPRLDEEEKEEAIGEYKEGIAAGVIQPTITNFSYVVTISDISEDAQMVELEANAYGQTYTSQMLCQNDTMYLARNKYPLVTEVDGKVTGYAIQGVQTIPLPVGAGDVLPYFEDIAVSIPETSNFTVPDSVHAGYRTVSSISTRKVSNPSQGYTSSRREWNPTLRVLRRPTQSQLCIQGK